MRRIEIQRLILPSARQRDTVDERGVHAEAAIVVLGLSGNREAARAVVVGRLSATAVTRCPVQRARVRAEKRRVALKMIAPLERDVSADYAVVVSCRIPYLT